MTRLSLGRLALCTLFSAVLASAAGCAAPTRDAPADPVETTTTGTVSGRVTYTGVKTGIVRVALYETYPPTGAPAAGRSYPAAGFPLTYDLEAPAGKYTAVAYLDVKGDGYEPSPGDPISGPTAVELSATVAASADIRLADTP